MLVITCYYSDLSFCIRSKLSFSVTSLCGGKCSFLLVKHSSERALFSPSSVCSTAVTTNAIKLLTTTYGTSHTLSSDLCSCSCTYVSVDALNFIFKRATKMLHLFIHLLLFHLVLSLLYIVCISYSL